MRQSPPIWNAPQATIKLANRGTHAKVLIALDDAAVATPDGRLLFKTGKQFICKGDRIVLLGPNGAGKTRLVAMLRQAIENPDAAQAGIKVDAVACARLLRTGPCRSCRRRHADAHDRQPFRGRRSACARTCSPAPACRLRCKAVRSAGFPADRRRVSACCCCGLPSQTSICSMSRPTIWISRDGSAGRRVTGASGKLPAGFTRSQFRADGRKPVLADQKEEAGGTGRTGALLRIDRRNRLKRPAA